MRHDHIRDKSPSLLLTLLLTYSTRSFQERFSPTWLNLGTLSKVFLYSCIQKFGDLARFCQLPKNIDFVSLWFRVTATFYPLYNLIYIILYYTLAISEVQRFVKYITISSPSTMPITYAAVFPRFSAHGTFRAKRLKRRVEERVRRDGCIRRQ